MIDLFHDEELPRFVLGRQIRVQKNRGQLKMTSERIDYLYEVMDPSVPMMMRQRPAGSLPLRAEVIASDGYARFASRKDSCRIWPRN
jgi:hypothetical protein